MRGTLGLVGVMLLLSACGGAVGKATGPTAGAPAAGRPSATATTSPAGPNVGGCFTEADGRVFTYRGSRGVERTGVIMGEGTAGAVISYELTGSVCTWRPLADRLKAAGYRVLLYDRGPGAPPVDLILDMVKRLRKAGVTRVFLIGGSVSGQTSIAAANRLAKPAAAVVNLSGAARYDEVERITVPLLQITAENDAVSPTRMLESGRAAVKSPDHPVVIVEGTGAHASRLFESPQAAMVLDTIMAFLAKYD